MVNIKFIIFFFIVFGEIVTYSQNPNNDINQAVHFKNTWIKPPKYIPNNVSIDAPLMGNGDLTMSVGFENSCLRYYLSKNDFWRLKSKADGLSGPRSVGFVDIIIDGLESEDFSAEQQIYNGKTTCFVGTEKNRFEITSWVSATENLIFIELNSLNKSANVTVSLTAPENKNAKLDIGNSGKINWLTRAFTDNVDKETKVAVALQTYLYDGDIIKVMPGKKLLIALSIESNFKKNEIRCNMY